MHTVYSIRISIGLELAIDYSKYFRFDIECLSSDEKSGFICRDWRLEPENEK